jgi:hypothetical protein
MITIKRRCAGEYYVAECPDITVSLSESGNWITTGKGYEDMSKTKREAVEYAQWIHEKG